MNLVDALANAGTGGIVGALASIGTGIVSIFQAKNQFVHDEKMAQINLDLTKLQGEIAGKVAEANFRTLVETQAGEAFTASQTAANQPSIPWIDGSVKMWRMALSCALIAMTTYFYCTTDNPDLKQFIVVAVVDLTGLSVGFFFGSRQMEKFIPSKPCKP